MHPLLRSLALGAALLAVGMAAAPPASAQFRLRVEDVGAGSGIVYTDNMGGDLNLTAGSISHSSAIGQFVVSVNTGTSRPILPVIAGRLSELDLSSISINTAGAGTFRITLEDTGYTAGLGNLLLYGGIGGVLTAPDGSTIAAQGWANPDNLVPALGADVTSPGALGAIGGIPAGSIGLFAGSGIANGPGAFAFAPFAPVPFVMDGPYALFMQATVQFSGPGSISFNLNEFITQGQAEVVPEPGSIALLVGFGLSGAAFLRRRRR